MLQVMTQTLKHGGAGCITATANLFSKQLRQLHDSFGAFVRCHPSSLAVVARCLTAVASSTAASDKDGALEKKVLALCQTGNASWRAHLRCSMCNGRVPLFLLFAVRSRTPIPAMKELLAHDLKGALTACSLAAA